MRWLLLKDLQILRRSKLLVATLVVYPALLAVLVGAATNAGPDKPRTAFLNEVPPSENEISVGSERIDAAKYARQIFDAIDPVRVKNRAEARQAVEDGRAIAALIVPRDITERLRQAFAQTGSDEPPEVEVLYNADNPVKERYVRNTIQSQLARANLVLSQRLTQVAADYIRIIAQGGSVPFLGIDILGLRNSQTIIEDALDELPADSPSREGLERVAEFAEVAADNLDVSEPILESIGQPIRVRETVVKGKSSSIDAFVAPLTVTVALTFVTLLLAAGMLALEREEHAFGRLVRGLVTRSALIAEKIGLAGLCSFAVTLLMLVLLAALTDLDWGRSPLWLPALALAALGFAALGVAVGCLAREVRSASLLVFALSLPMAALALVPSGAVSGGLFTVIDVINFLLPFKPSLQALDAAINDADPGLGLPLLHLAGLTVAFAGIARLALRRFA